MGKIMIEKINRRVVLLKCNGCTGCEFHYAISSMSQFGRDWDDRCKLHKYEDGDHEGWDHLLCAEGYSRYDKNQEMMKKGLYPKGKRFLWKDVKKVIQREVGEK